MDPSIICDPDDIVIGNNSKLKDLSELVTWKRMRTDTKHSNITRPILTRIPQPMLVVVTRCISIVVHEFGSARYFSILGGTRLSESSAWLLPKVCPPTQPFGSLWLFHQERMCDREWFSDVCEQMTRPNPWQTSFLSLEGRLLFSECILPHGFTCMFS